VLEFRLIVRPWTLGRTEAVGRLCERASLGSDTYSRQRSGRDVRYQFEDCVLDPDRREFTRGAEAIAIGPQVFDLLLYLVENRERVLTKDSLIDVVWGGRIISESPLTSAHLRKSR
jgi:DNA-binding response OmpR family regulator